MNHILAIVALYNILVLCIYGADKRRAIRGGQRISERTLLTMAFCLGAAGALAGMWLFQHKTRHLRFRLLLPLALLVNAAILLAAYLCLPALL